MRHPKGFSLVELVTVIALLGILTLALIPRDYLQTTYLETAAQRVENDLRYAQHLARITNTNHGVNFVAGSSYTVYQQTVATPATSPLTRQNLVKDIGQEFENVSILNTVQFEFNPIGRPVLGGGSNVLIGDGTNTVTLQILPETGVVQRL